MFCFIGREAYNNAPFSTTEDRKSACITQKNDLKLTLPPSFPPSLPPFSQEMIEGGDVLVNWKEMKSANSLLKGGDIVTIRGKGRLEVTEVETTSKGKFRVKMTKFV